MSSRKPTAYERAVLDALLAHEFDGVEPLRDQWRAAQVTSSCGCGCGSTGFDIAPDARKTLSPSPAASPLPVEAEVVNAEGEAVGGLFVLLRDGWLDDVDVYSYAGEPIPFPSPQRVRWRA